MNFEEFKNQYFDGNEDRALAHCAYESYHQDFILTGNQEKLQNLLDTLDRKKASRFMKFLRIEIRMNKTIIKKRYSPILDVISGNDTSWKYDEDFIRNGNPFGKKIRRNIMIFAIGVFIISIALILVNITELKMSFFGEIIPYFYLVFGGYMVPYLYQNIDDYF